MLLLASIYLLKTYDHLTTWFKIASLYVQSWCVCWTHTHTHTHTQNEYKLNAETLHSAFVKNMSTEMS
jgi:hypothetical protein